MGIGGSKPDKSQQTGQGSEAPAGVDASAQVTGEPVVQQGVAAPAPAPETVPPVLESPAAPPAPIAPPEIPADVQPEPPVQTPSGDGAQETPPGDLGQDTAMSPTVERGTTTHPLDTRPDTLEGQVGTPGEIKPEDESNAKLGPSFVQPEPPVFTAPTPAEPVPPELPAPAPEPQEQRGIVDTVGSPRLQGEVGTALPGDPAGLVKPRIVEGGVSSEADPDSVRKAMAAKEEQADRERIDRVKEGLRDVKNILEGIEEDLTQIEKRTRGSSDTSPQTPVAENIGQGPGEST